MAHSVKTKISDLDAAIRSLEVSTNPTLRRPCNCNASRHPLLTAAPNCLNCGKIICIKEGLGPCTFCGHALLSAEETQSMIRTLREERGRERMEANNASHRRAEVTKTSARAFLSSTSSSPSRSASLSAAEQHRDKLLGFQETSARRTRIIDEAADFETPSAGLSMWATPQERALQLKQQQRTLREQEWNAKQDYEKRQMVVSIDLAGRKVTKKMADVERPSLDEDGSIEGDGDEIVEEASKSREKGGGGGTFSNNPLLGGLIRPTYPGDRSKGKEVVREDDANKEEPKGRMQTWRRVQDDYDDNEQVILDGGVYGRMQDREDQSISCG